MTPEEQDRYRSLTAELERLETVKKELSDLAATVFERDGAKSYQVNGEEILLCLAKNGAPYFAARSRWAKTGKPSIEKAPVSVRAPAVRTKRAIVNGQIVNVPVGTPIETPKVGRIIEATAVLTSSARIREQPIEASDPIEVFATIARDQAQHLEAMVEELPDAMARMLPDMQEMVPELQTKILDQANSLNDFADSVDTKSDAMSELRAAIAASTKPTTKKKSRGSAPVFSDPDAEEFEKFFS